MRLLPSSQSLWSLSLSELSARQLFSKCATVPALGHDVSLSFPLSLQGQALVSALVTLRSVVWVDIDLRALPQLERGGERLGSAVGLDRPLSLRSVTPRCKPAAGPSVLRIYNTRRWLRNALAPL